jgi:hypothetical protein
MASYIGRTPTIGNFQKCDAISVVNGQATYGLTVNSVAVFPESANHVLCSLNGILQAPQDSFTISSSNIVFASNLSTGDVIDFVMILGNVLDLGVPSDNTVSLAKLTATGTKDATTFLRGDNTFAVPIDNGKVLQVVQAIDTSTSNTTGTTFVGSGTGVSITPSSTSSKVYISAMMTVESQDRAYFSIYRDSTNLGDANGLVMSQVANVNVALSMHYLDSPNTTSAVSYEVYFRSQTSGQQSNAIEPIVLVAMEIGA